MLTFFMSTAPNTELVDVKRICDFEIKCGAGPRYIFANAVSRRTKLIYVKSDCTKRILAEE